jgi:hypothetical protein
MGSSMHTTDLTYHQEQHGLLRYYLKFMRHMAGYTLCPPPPHPACPNNYKIKNVSLVTIATAAITGADSKGIL